MGHVVDRWTVPGPSGRRVKGPRYGVGKRWRARWVEADGRERSQSFAAKEAAVAKVAEVDVAIRGGTYVRDSSITFEAYAREWLSHQLHQRSGTAEQAASKLVKHAFPVIGSMRLTAVTRADVQRLITGATALGPDARRVLYVYVRAVFAAAVEDRLIQTSPCRKINLPKIERNQVVPLTVPQVHTIAEQMLKHLVGAVWVGAGTGLRPGELRGLTVDRIEGDLLRVDRQLAHESRAGRPVWGPLKTDASPRMIRMAPVTQQRLGEHLERFPPGPTGLVFATARGQALSRSAMGYAWRIGVAGVLSDERSGWHDLRHHHASLLIAAGSSPRAVADRLGHADPSETLRTYAHLWPSDEARMLAAVQDAYEG